MSKKETTLEQAIANQFQTDIKNVDVNVSSGMFLTTEDKVKLCLEEHVKYLEKRREWLTPFGLLLTLLAALLTASFKDIGLSASVWQALFILGAIGSGIWLLKSLLQLPKAKTVEDVVREMKGRKTASKT